MFFWVIHQWLVSCTKQVRRLISHFVKKKGHADTRDLSGRKKTHTHTHTQWMELLLFFCSFSLFQVSYCTSIFHRMSCVVALIACSACQSKQVGNKKTEGKGCLHETPAETGRHLCFQRSQPFCYPAWDISLNPVSTARWVLFDIFNIRLKIKNVWEFHYTVILRLIVNVNFLGFF